MLAPGSGFSTQCTKVRSATACAHVFTRARTLHLTHPWVACPVAAINGPQFVTGYPSVVSSDTDRVRMDIMVVWPGTVYVMVLPGNSDAPSVAAVIAGTDPNSVATVRAQVYDELFVRPIQLTGLDAGTAYDVYFAIQNFENPPKESAAVTLLRVETTGGAWAWRLLVCARVGVGSASAPLPFAAQSPLHRRLQRAIRRWTPWTVPALL